MLVLVNRDEPTYVEASLVHHVAVMRQTVVIDYGHDVHGSRRIQIPFETTVAATEAAAEIVLAINESNKSKPIPPKSGK